MVVLLWLVALAGCICTSEQNITELFPDIEAKWHSTAFVHPFKLLFKLLFSLWCSMFIFKLPVGNHH